MWTEKRISERSAAEVKRHRLFEGETDGGKVGHARTRLNVGEGRAQRLSVPEDGHTEDIMTGDQWTPLLHDGDGQTFLNF